MIAIRTRPTNWRPHISPIDHVATRSSTGVEREVDILVDEVSLRTYQQVRVGEGKGEAGLAGAAQQEGEDVAMRSTWLVFPGAGGKVRKGAEHGKVVPLVDEIKRRHPRART